MLSNNTITQAGNTNDLSIGQTSHFDSLQQSDESLLEIKRIEKAVHKSINLKKESIQILPPVAVKLLTLTNDESSSIGDLAKIIETESFLSLEILRLVNSAYYQLPHKISSIKRAVTILGFSLIRQIALNLLFLKKLIRRKSKAEFNQILYWQHSLFVAVLSKFIAIEIKHPEPDLLYTTGLFHDFGKLVLENYGRHSYSEFLHYIRNSDHHSLLNERSFFGVTHAEAGAVFCAQAGFPHSIYRVILNHHCIDNTSIIYDKQIQQNIAIIAYANYIAWIQNIDSDERALQPKLGIEIFTIIKNFDLDIEPILQHVDNEMMNISQFYNIPFPGLNELRANLVNAIFNHDLLNSRKYKQSQPRSQTELRDYHPQSMTIPHHSLNPDEFIPWTLEAIQKEFYFDRLIILDISPRMRSLIATHWWPEKILLKQDNSFEIIISSLSGQLLSSLRNQQAMLISLKHQENQLVLEKLQVDSFFSLPILKNKRLSSVLYIDNFISKKALDKSLLTKLNHITIELGFALDNARQYEKEKKKAQIDHLTGLNNKAMINKVLNHLFEQRLDNQAQLKQFSLGFIDIDYFKVFNDSYGHEAGDDVLKIVADLLKSLTRPGDFIGRYGGEEFLFVLLNSDRTGTKKFAERIRFDVERKGKILKKRFPKQSLSVSIGVATRPEKYQNYQQMINAADRAMYQSKQNGRNRVTIID